MILLVVGKLASGKDHIAKYISDKYGYKFIISTTSRIIREGEKDGIDYNYVDKERFEELIKSDSLVEYSVTAGKYYGIEKSEISGDNMISVVDMNGVRRLREKYPERVKVIYLTVPEEIRLERALKRGSFDKTIWEQRLVEEANNFSGAEAEVDYVIPNIDEADTIQEIDNLMERWA